MLLAPAGHLIGRAPDYVPVLDSERIACQIGSVIIVWSALGLMLQARRVSNWLHPEPD